MERSGIGLHRTIGCSKQQRSPQRSSSFTYGRQSARIGMRRSRRAMSVDLRVRLARVSNHLKRQEYPVLGVSVVALVAGGIASWPLIQPGQSLIWPIVLDVLVYFAIAAGFRLLMKVAHVRTYSRRSPKIIVFIAVFGILWTYFGALPASVIFDTAAVGTAHYEVALPGTGPCRLVQHGSVGKLSAPYKICTRIDGRNSIVEFATPNLSRGYAYIMGPSWVSWFPDECARHLFGNWWAFHINPYTAVPGCPFGYGGQGA